MSNLAKSIPPAAEELLDLIRDCEDIVGFPNGTLLHPDGKIIFNGVVNPGDKKPDGGEWKGDRPLYLIVYRHPLNKPGLCDAHWFELDVIDVPVAEVAEDSELQALNINPVTN